MNERILVILNKSIYKQDVELKLPAVYKINNAKDIISEKIYEVKNNLISINVTGIKSLVLILE